MTTKTAIKKIFSIRIKVLQDENPDFSCLGEYSNTPNSPYSIKRKNVRRNEYCYFNPNWQNYEGETPEIIQKYCDKDYQRMEDYNDELWYYIGIRAEADVGISFDGGKNFKLDKITSGGLWGIESDSGENDIKAIKNDEYNNLKEILEAYGFEDIPGIDEIYGMRNHYGSIQN